MPYVFKHFAVSIAAITGMLAARGKQVDLFGALVLALVLQAGGEAGGCVISTSVSREGRLEMLWDLRAQSISTDYHRHGNLGLRADAPRAEVL